MISNLLIDKIRKDCMQQNEFLNRLYVEEYDDSQLNNKTDTKNKEIDLIGDLFSITEILKRKVGQIVGQSTLHKISDVTEDIDKHFENVELVQKEKLYNNINSQIQKEE
eukprot:544918_1